MKTMKISVKIADDPSEIRSEQLPDTNLSLHKSVHEPGPCDSAVCCTSEQDERKLKQNSGLHIPNG